MFCLHRLNPSNPSIKHFVDIIYDVEPREVDIDNVSAIIRDKAWEELPDVLKLAERPTFTYLSQFFLINQVDGKVCVPKHYYIKEEKVKGAYVMRLIKGTGHEIAWSTLNKQKARRGFQWMLEQLGGTHFRHFSLSAEKRKPKFTGPTSQNEEEQDAGWDFIIEKGERDKGQLKQLRWIHRNIHREGSPIQGWSEKLVQRALDSLANDGSLASLVTRYDLTIQALEPEIMELIETLVPFLRGHALWLLGEPGVGKTPLARIIARMFSRHYGGSGTFRTASDFDFFRGVHFDKTVPALYDDGEIGGELIKKKKAFSDVGDEETILKERWTAAKFVQHQLRIVLDNQYEPKDQPEDAGMCDSLCISHAAFMKLVRPAIGYIASADAMAILKRAVFIIFAKDHIYYHPPSEKECNVKRIRWPRGDLFADSCKHIISNMKANGPVPSNYDDKTAWEQEWLKEAFRKHDNPAPAPPTTPEPRSATPLLDALLRADGHAPTQTFVPIAVKQEVLERRFPRLAPSRTLCIELSDSSTPPSPNDAGQGLALPVGIFEEDVPDFMPAVGDCPDEPDQAHFQDIPPEDSMPLGYSELSDADAAACCIGGASFKDACLITSLQNLGLPVSCSSHGPFPISFGNQLLQPLGLSLRQHVGLPALLDGRYVVHDSSKEHFFALKVVEGTLTKLDGDMMQDLSLSDGRQMLEDPVFTFFQVQQLTRVPFHLPPATGGAGGVCKKPSANTEDPVTHFACPLEQCTHKDCKGNLITTKDVAATLYGMNGPTTVLHVQKQCSSRSCRTCFGCNYRWEQGI